MWTKPAKQPITAWGWVRARLERSVPRVFGSDVVSEGRSGGGRSRSLLTFAFGVRCVGFRRQFKLRRSNILTLPRPEETSGAIFPVGSRVMTLYPHTTTFYPATITGNFVEGQVREAWTKLLLCMYSNSFRFCVGLPQGAAWLLNGFWA